MICYTDIMEKTENDFQKIMDLVLRLDQMKHIYRRTRIIGTGTFEDDAQHSFHICAMAVLLAPYANQPVQLEKTLKMLLFHDVVELEAGDTFCYDEEAKVDKVFREQQAAKNIFGRLPSHIGEELFALWEEFEAAETPEAQFANALDRSQPILNNYFGEGGSWKEHGVTKSQVLERIAPVQAGSRAIYDYVRNMVEEGVTKGWLIDR